MREQINELGTGLLISLELRYARFTIQMELISLRQIEEYKRHNSAVCSVVLCYTEEMRQ
jgi:hypothetical protein